ncbi:hypothetical protein EMIT0P176_70035 [Pseudomonas sp. IT-P176]
MVRKWDLGSGLTRTTYSYDIPPCRSELARDELKNNAFNQTIRVIVNVHREQAASGRSLPQGAMFQG